MVLQSAQQDLFRILIIQGAAQYADMTIKLINVTDRLQIGPRASVSTIEALSAAATVEVMGESKSREFSKEDMEDVPSPVLWNVGLVAQMSF